MNTTLVFLHGRLSWLSVVIFAACILVQPSARAGLTVDVHLYHDSDGYYFYPYLSANTNLPGFPDGLYEIASPQIPTGGSQLQYFATNNTIGEIGGGGNYYGDFASYVYGITNGQWSISVATTTSTNLYFFTVSVSGFTSDDFGGAPQALYPVQGEINIPNQPLFQWLAPTTNWAGTLYVQDYFIDTNGDGSFVTSQNLSPGATSWMPGVVLPNGTNQFSLTYQSNVTAVITASQPTNTAGQPISAWVSTATLETHFVYGNQYNVSFTVGSPANDYDPFLVARYNFEDTNNPYADSSGNDYYNDCTSSSGTNADTFSTDAAVGQYARLFFGDTSFCFSPNDPAYQYFSNALSGNFSVTAWVKTTNSVSGDYANAYFGAPIFFAGADYNNHCTIPLSITGSKAAFTIVSSDGPGTVTLQSTTSVNDGNYHFLAVTRQQSTGLMCVYVDGNLEATGNGITDPVITQGYISIAGGYYQYAGLLDDVRLYSTNLSAADVANIAGSSIQSLAGAIGATNLLVTTSGDSLWFIETTNTYGGALAAAQSGATTNYQTSTLSAVVTGPGTLTFNWSSQDADPNQSMDYEFAIDDLYTNDIEDLYGGNQWQSITATYGGFIPIPPGQHTLIWSVYGNGDADPNMAGFLDNVVFTPPDTSPVSANITLSIYREQDPTFGNIFIAFPGFNSVTPAGTGTTTNIIQSPNNYFSTQADQGGGGSSSAILFSLDSLLSECTNGLWSLYINYGQPNERQFNFSVSINGLTSNLLSAVEIITPTNGATGIPLNTAFQWLGPSNYSNLYVSKQYVDGSGNVNTNLPVNATNWPSPPMLTAGTNQFYISYTSNNFPGVTFSVPVDANDTQTVASWTTAVSLNDTATANFVAVAGPSRVILRGPQAAGGNFQFAFVSQTGFTNTVYFRTNLVAGNWLVWTNIPGDGTTKTDAVPMSLFAPSKSGFIRVVTH